LGKAYTYLSVVLFTLRPDSQVGIGWVPQVVAGKAQICDRFYLGTVRAKRLACPVWNLRIKPSKAGG